MTHGRPRRTGTATRLRAGAVACGLAVAAVAGLAGPASHAAAATDAGIAVDQLAPAVITTEGTVQLSGTVNAGDTALTEVSVQVRASERRINGRADLSARAGNPDPTRAGSVVPGGIVRLADLAPGASQRFSLTIPASSFPFAQAGVYVGGVELRATAGGQRGRQAFEQLLLPAWRNGAVGVRTPLATTLTLSDRPQMDATGALLGDDIVDELSPGGRLARLVTAGQGRPVSWFVDPDLLNTASALSSGARVRLPDGSVETRPPDPAAATWLRDVRSAVTGAGASAALLPYGDSDVTALQRGGYGGELAASVDRAVTVGEAVLGTASPSQSPAWPPGGTDASTLRALQSLGVSSVVLPASQYPRRDGQIATGSAVVDLPADTGGLRGLLADDALTSALSRDTRPSGAAVAVRQQVLSDTYLIALERPSESRPQVLLSPRIWDPAPGFTEGLLDALSTAPWLSVTTLERLAAGDPDTGRRTGFRYDGQNAELPQSLLAVANPARTAITGLSQVLDDPAPVVNPIAAAIINTASAAWRDDTASGAGYATTITTQSVATGAGIRLIPRESVTLTGRSGTIPLTIANDLSQAATVRVAVAARPSVRLSLSDPGVVHIDPGRRVSVEVQADASASGVVVVDTRLLTTAGDPYGPNQAFPVRVQALGLVAGWTLTGILVVLLLLTVVRIVLRVRRSGGDGA